MTGAVKREACYGILVAGIVFSALLAIYGRTAWHSGMLADDPGLFLGARSTFADGNGLGLLFRTYGPQIIRPFQLWGFYFEYWILGLPVQALYFIGFGLLAISCGILTNALVPAMGTAAAVFASLCIAVSPYAGEPLMWLSDRHDLYMFFFCSLALWISSKVMKALTAGTLIFWISALFLAYWGAFYSNEKGIMAPLFCGMYALWRWYISRSPVSGSHISSSNQAQIIPLRTILLIFFTTGLIALVGYFTMRFLVLGKLIGGYDNRIFPPDTSKFEVIWRIMVNLLATPWTTPTASVSTLHRSLLGALFGIFAWTKLRLLGNASPSVSKARRDFVAGFFMFVLAATASTAPTLKWVSAVSPFEVFNGRMRWLPAITVSIGLGIVLGSVWTFPTGKVLRVLFRTLVLAYLFSAAFQVRFISHSFQIAQNYTRDTTKFFETYCTCVDTDNPQISGLELGVRSVNTFPFEGLIETMSEIRGLPKCAPPSNPLSNAPSGIEVADGRCRLEFNPSISGVVQVIPRKISSNKHFQGNLIPESEQINDYPLTHELLVVCKKNLSDSKEFLLVGPVQEAEGKRSPEKFVITLGDETKLVTPPNWIHPMGRHRGKSRNGLFIPLRLSNSELATSQRLKVSAISRKLGPKFQGKFRVGTVRDLGTEELRAMVCDS